MLSSARCIAAGGRPTYMHSHNALHFNRCMMETPILERRRLLRLVVLSSLAAPAIALASCATGGRRQIPRIYGGNSGGKSGNGGGPGAKGSGGGK